MRQVALLRGVNVGAAGKGRKAVPMAELRALCERLGWRDVASYIQSGNVAFTAKGDAAKLEQQLERAISERFGFDVPVVVRATTALAKAEATCPFKGEAEARPNLVHIGFAKGKVSAAMAKAVMPYCTSGERVLVKGQVIWADYANGVGRSKLTPAVLDRAFGASVTMRNIKTLRAVLEL